MCGIAGIYSYYPAAMNVDRDELRRIRDDMARRGPDAQGEWFSENGVIALAHRRLSIIDLSERGAQPMISEDGRWVISFNGEIYNYRALRTTLEQAGFSFYSDSDTEVLLKLYIHKGEAMFADLRGMYAFALWDMRKRVLLLARDPYGIKPLYYTNDGRTLRFASQVKALLAGQIDSREPDPAGLAGFLLMGSVPEPYTTYRAVRALPAGHYLWVNDQGVGQPHPHFSVADIWRRAAAEPQLLNEALLQSAVTEALHDSVRRHLVADVPVGAFLSAGIDSGALVGMMREVGTTEIQSVTLGFAEFRGQHQDETELAAELARQYGSQHTIRWIDDAEVERDLPDILAAMDQPSVDGINTWLVSKAAHEQGLKVVVSGVGGDELFGGYSHFNQLPRWHTHYQRLNRIPGLVAFGHGLSRIVAQWGWIPPKAPALLRYGADFPGLYLAQRGLFMPWELPALLGPERATAGLAELQPPEFIRSALGAEPVQSFATIAALESSFYLRNQLLRDSDWASMAHSLELRTPLVDAQLLTTLAPLLVQRLPPLHAKRPLANAPTPCLPASIIDRPKTGFALPMSRWLEHTQVLDHWRRLPPLAQPCCHWSRRMAYALIADLIQ